MKRQTIARILRWVARIWSLLALALALLVILTPDPYAVRPITATEIFLLSFWGIAILGLLIGWIWERLGGFIAIFTMAVRELVYWAVTGEWIINFLLIWVLVIPPAVMYLLVGQFSDKTPKVEA